MLINSDRVFVIRISQNFLAITFSPSNAVTKPALIITPVPDCQGRQAVPADGADGERPARFLASAGRGRVGKAHKAHPKQIHLAGGGETPAKGTQTTSLRCFHSDSLLQEWSWVARGLRQLRKECLQPLHHQKGSAWLPAGIPSLAKDKAGAQSCQDAAQDSEVFITAPHLEIPGSGRSKTSKACHPLPQSGFLNLVKMKLHFSRKTILW